MWVFIIALLAVLWEELVPNRFSKIILRMALYSAALFVYFTYTKGVIKNSNDIQNEIREEMGNEFTIPDLNDVPINEDSSLESKDSVRIDGYESKTAKEYSPNLIF